MKRIFLLLIFLSSSIVVFSQDRFTLLEEKLNQEKTVMPGLDDKVQLAVNAMSIQDFVQGIAINHGLNVTVDAGLDIKVTNTFKDVTAQDIFMYLCKRYDLDINFIGPIMTIIKYQPPVVKEVKVNKKKVNLSYDSTANLLSYDLNNDSLEQVAKEITRVSGKNIAYAPDLEGKRVNGFVQNVPFNTAMDKLAFANDLKVTLTEDNFYLIEKNVKDNSKNNNGVNGNNGGLSNKNNTGKQINGLNFSIENGLITADAQNVPINDIVGAISGTIGYNYFLFNDLKGNATVNVTDASYEDFLSYLFNGTDYTFKREGGIYLFGDRNLEGLRVSKLLTLKNRTIDKIMDFIPADLKKGVDVKVFEDLNGIILSGSQPRIKELETFLRELDIVVPNVYIEVIIADIRKSNTFSAGITAGLGDKPATTGGTILPLNMTLSSNSINNAISGINGLASLNLGQVTPNFYMTLQAMETQGIVKIHSTPQLATLNGHKAELSIGETQFYQEISNNLVQSTAQSNLLQTQQYKSVNADLNVSILPQISSDEQITMDIHVKQSSFTERISTTAPPGTINRDFKSIIRVKNGEMIMLGGLEYNEKNETGTGVPFLSRVPILKWIFGSRSRKKADNKLTIFIRPIIIYS